MRLLKIGFSLLLVMLFSFNYPECKKIIKRTFKDNKYNIHNEYKAVLEIPKIAFKRGLYDINSHLNNVDNNIAFLNNTEYPSSNSNTVIIGHSGSGDKAYFNDLSKLDINDNIYLYYDNNKYNFIIDNIYLVYKDGNVLVERDKNKMTLTLITCYSNNYQLVIIAYKK